jgi:hypothetical protein
MGGFGEAVVKGAFRDHVSGQFVPVNGRRGEVVFGEGRLSSRSPPRRLFSSGRSRARAECLAPSRSTATKPRTARPGSSSPNIGAAHGRN